MLLGKSRGQLRIAPENMMWLDQSRNDAHLWLCLVVKVNKSRNDAHLWLCLVVKVKSNAVKNNIV